jgi:hypothetical protein
MALVPGKKWISLRDQDINQAPVRDMISSVTSVSSVVNALAGLTEYACV